MGLESFKDYLDLNNPPYGSGTEAAQKENQFREKWSYAYERVIMHRIKKKYCQIVRDLMLLEEVFSFHTKDELFYTYMIDQETRGDEEEAQRLITFWNSIQKINEKKKEGEND